MRRGAAWLIPLVLASSWLVGLTIYLVHQEVPTAQLRGVALAEETGRPLRGATIRLQLLEPPAEGVETQFALHTRAGGQFHTERIPAGLYRLQASSAAHRLRPTRLVLEEGEVKEVTLELSPAPSFFELQIAQNTVTPDEMPRVVAHGFLLSPSLDFHFYQVNAEALVRKYHGYLGRLLQSQRPPQHLMLEGNPELTPAGELSAPITRRDAEGVFHQRFDLPPLAGRPGIYLVVARADSLEEIEWLMVTRLGLIVKRWGDQALAYVADLKSGDPVPGARVEFAMAEGGSTSGLTDQDGIFEGRLPPPGRAPETHLLARAEKEGSQAFLTTYVWRPEGEGQERVYSYTDRPVYRPGHVVNFKGIARRFSDNTYSVLSGQQVLVQAWDSRESLVYKADLKTNQYGSFTGGFRLNDEAATGLYRLVTTIDGRPHESMFKVAEYRKPEYSVEVAAAKKRYTRGETIEVEASAQYYFGAPVAGAEVSYLVRRSAYWFYPWGEGEDQESYYEEEGYEYGEVIEEGESRTDAEGIARLKIRTSRPLSLRWQEGVGEEEEEQRDYRYTIEVMVTDPSRKEVTGEGSTLVTRAEFALFLEPLRYVVGPDQETKVQISAVGYDGRPVPGVRVSLAAGLESYTDGKRKLEVEARGEVTTDEQGKAAFGVTPRAQGSYRVEARAADRYGNRIRESAFLWVTGLAYTDLEIPYPDLEIVADKKMYRPGETAVLLINSKLKGATALVTVEGPKLYEHRLVALKGNSTRVELPITAEHEPNFFLCAAVVRDKRFATQRRRIRVSVEERRLQVTVKPDKPRYRPGEKATYQLRTADWRGRPLPAELSIGVVDESIYAIQSEMAEPILRFFYPPRENSVHTSYSFAQIYLDADKEAVAIKVRKRFPDTAYWNPTVVTGPDGAATVSFDMPDTLTTWRATVRAASLATEVGEAVAKVICTKDLLVRLEMPRFLTQKDQATISAVAHSYLDRKRAMAVWLDAPRLDFTRRPRAGEQVRFELAPEGVRRQDWQVAAPSPGEVEVTAYLKATDKLSDAMALPLPIRPHGRERVEWRAGAVAGSAIERLPVRQDAVPGASELRLRLAPSLASALLGALDYLAQYPYGCTEQTMSAFLPDVFVARALRELELPNPRLERELPDMVQKGLNRLYGYQHDDGGWGWCRYDESDPWMTAYVVFGLLTAKRSGFPVNERFLNSGLDRLVRHMQQVAPPGGPERAPARERLYVLYVLSLAGRDGGLDQHLTNLYQRLNSLDASEVALLTSALLARERAGEARVAARRLWGLAEETRSGVSWRGMEGWGRGGAIETTALAFQALLAINAEDPRLPKVARSLALSREGNHWASTRDTAFVLYALTDYLKRSRELRPDYEATVSLNGKPLLARRFTQADLFAPEVEVKVARGALRVGDNLLQLDKKGTGSLYYTLTLRQFVGQEDIAKLITGAGISVDRQYYRLSATRNPRTGVISISPGPRPTTALRSGESVLVKLTITTPREHDYVVIEDPLPAGCEVAEQGKLEPWEWDRWWSDMDVRDEKVAIFARRLPAGTSTIEYHLRPQIPGDYHVMPTEVYAMYNPGLRGSGAETRVTLR